MSKRNLLSWGGFLLIGIGILVMLAALPGVGFPSAGEQNTQPPSSPPTRAPTTVPQTQTPEPIVPTRTPTGVATAASTHIRPTDAPTATPLPSLPPPPSPSPTLITAHAAADLWRGRPRWGVGVSRAQISHYNVEPLRLGWYVNWGTQLNPPRPGDVEYVQTVRLWDGILRPDAEAIAATARANPGSIWLIGNEPDVKWQDNLEPAIYAQLYHEAYTAIKTADSTAQVAIGGVAQPTPLRMRYLDAALTTYNEQFGEQMPMDIWNVHAFILREERGSWGVDIPPGLPDDRGMLYEIDDNDDMAIFRRQIVDFRRWMAERGYQNYPLIVSEYGIPMPEDYGFPTERVLTFLRGTFDFFSSATDPALGYPKDGYRLVQRWCWYSLDDADYSYPTGRLFDPSTGQMTAVGQGWVEYVNAH